MARNDVGAYQTYVNNTHRGKIVVQIKKRRFNITPMIKTNEAKLNRTFNLSQKRFYITVHT